MITRSKKKTVRVEPEKRKKPVRLTEDLLYIVNKKLKSMDKEARDKKLHEMRDEDRPFTAGVTMKSEFSV